LYLKVYISKQVYTLLPANVRGMKHNQCSLPTTAF